MRVRGILREVCDPANVDDGLRCRREWSNDGMSRRFEVERPREKNIPIEPSFSDVFCAYGQYDTEFRNSGLNRDIFFSNRTDQRFTLGTHFRYDPMRTLKILIVLTKEGKTVIEREFQQNVYLLIRECLFANSNAIFRGDVEKRHVFLPTGVAECLGVATSARCPLQ